MSNPESPTYERAEVLPEAVVEVLGVVAVAPHNEDPAAKIRAAEEFDAKVRAENWRRAVLARQARRAEHIEHER